MLANLSKRIGKTIMLSIDFRQFNKRHYDIQKEKYYGVR